MSIYVLVFHTLLLRLVALVFSGNQTVVTLEGFQGKLELGLDGLSSHLLDFAGEHFSRRGSTINAVCLDGNENTAADLEEPVGIHGNNTGLIGLGNVGEDDIDHGNDHAIPSGLTGVLNNGNDVGSPRCHADEVTSRSGRELDCVDISGRAN